MSEFAEAVGVESAMKDRIEIKSLVLGALLGVLALLALGAVAPQGPNGGRFRLVVAEGQDQVFKIDTMTGQAWKTDVSRPSGAFMKANLEN